MIESKYDIAREFTSGLSFWITATSARRLTESDHWIAGWDAGYSMRAEKNRLLNNYLVSIGREPMAVIRLADSE